jgi:hypothetical protein
VYAVVPVGLKLLAVALLWRWRHVLETASVTQLPAAARTPCGACET